MRRRLIRMNIHRAGLPLSAAILAVLSSPASASGALWCNIDDGNLKLAVESGVTHGMGAPFFNFRASAELRIKDVAFDFRKLTLDDKLVHSWIEGGDTRLLFYAERQGGEPFASLTLTIKVQSGADDEADAAGTYELSYFEADRQKGEDDGFIHASGIATCGAE